MAFFGMSSSLERKYIRPPSSLERKYIAKLELVRDTLNTLRRTIQDNAMLSVVADDFDILAEEMQDVTSDLTNAQQNTDPNGIMWASFQEGVYDIQETFEEALADFMERVKGYYDHCVYTGDIASAESMLQLRNIADQFTNRFDELDDGLRDRLCARVAQLRTTPRNICAICCDNPVEQIIHPCNHVCMCSVCARHLAARRELPTCPICRVSIAALRELLLADPGERLYYAGS